MALINSLEIKNFKLFRDLHIKQLGRVNLIVGKNNVGKSTLLEALWLYANQGSPEIIRQILEDRGEMIYSMASHQDDGYLMTIRHLFYGREDTEIDNQPILIKTNNKSMLLSVQVGSDQQGSQFSIEIDGNSVRKYPIESLFRGYSKTFEFEEDETYVISVKQNRCVFIKTKGVEQLDLWNNIVLSGLEDNVLGMLQILINDAERLTVISPRRVSSRQQQPIFTPLLKLKGISAPISLRSYGEGMYRIFGLGLALVNAKDGVLLVDEIESGLHYTIQADMWKHVFTLAHNLNIQVFATTHSWDCIKAFELATRENPEDGVLIRLSNKNGEVTSVSFDEEELAIATSGTPVELR